MIETVHLSVGYRGTPVLNDVTLRFPPGQIVALLGPNGCGKSSLIRTIVGLQPGLGGQVLVDSAPASALSPRQMALKAAYLPQSRPVPNITARRMVLHGRFPHLSYPRRCRPEDLQAAARALAWVGAEDIADRPLPELSGGQRQKVYLAMALAQDTETIFMDEPTTYLDVRHQLDVMAVARRLADEGRSIVLVLHDLCLAMRTADEAVILADGRVCCRGTPDQVFASGALGSAFGITVARFRTERGWQYYYD